MTELSYTTSRVTDMLSYVLTPIQGYLDDPTVTDIACNSDGRCWIKRFSSSWEATGVTLEVSDRRRLMDVLAARQMDELSTEKPSLSTTLPSGERIECTIEPLSPGPTFTIRQRARVIYRLEDFCTDGILTAGHVEVLRSLVHGRRNILVCGPVGSAKSTLLNALLLEVDPLERVAIIEDVDELQITIPNMERFLTREGVASLRTLVRKALRLQIDRLVIGEVRGPEALDMLDAWNTGHAGMCTTHAESSRGALLRLEKLMQEVVPVPDRELIASVVHVVVVMASVAGGQRPRLMAIDAVHGWQHGAYQLEALRGA